MSGESVLAFFRKPKTDPYRERFEIESDRRLFGCLGSGSGLGMLLAVYALSIQIIPDPGRRPPDERWDPRPPVRPKPSHDEFIRVRPPADYHGSLSAQRRSRQNARPHSGPVAGHTAPKPAVKKPAAQAPGVLVAALITSKGRSGALAAYDLIGKTVRDVDLDKLEAFGSLTRTDKTRLGGRMGRHSDTFNEAYYGNGTGDKDGTGIRLPGWTGPKAIPGGGMRKPESLGKIVEVDQILNSTSRSTASILAVIRSHSPGLRHVYTTHLKQRPGLAGKITLRFAIAPSGEVVDVGLAGSTTSDADFDAQVVEQVMGWRFEAVKAPGNDLVTVPFNFSE